MGPRIDCSSREGEFGTFLCPSLASFIERRPSRVLMTKVAGAAQSLALSTRPKKRAGGEEPTSTGYSTGVQQLRL